MAVKGSGQLSMLNDIVAEFGGTAPHKMSEYYGGAGLVPAGANPNVPSSGRVGMKQFYNSVAATVLSITSNQSQYNIATEAVAAGGDLNTPVILTIDSGVTVSSSDPTVAAMTTGTGWGSGTTVNITNNGTIQGATGQNTSSYAASGGSGGNGQTWRATGGGSGSNASTPSADSSNNGGAAYNQEDSTLLTVFDTLGTVSAGAAGTKTAYGGGGGGAGSGMYGRYMGPTGGIQASGPGGGGGAGTPAGGGGNFQNYRGGQSPNPYPFPNRGNSGNTTGGGNSGTEGYPTYGPAGNGGGLGGSGNSSWGYYYDGNNPNSRGYQPGSGGSGGSHASASGSAGSQYIGTTGNISGN